MKNSLIGLRRHSGRILCAGLLLSMASTIAAANENCQRLEALDRQYRGVALTPYQKNMKRQLVSWYKQNCGSMRRASARR